jgi:hypothetical protein
VLVCRGSLCCPQERRLSGAGGKWSEVSRRPEVMLQRECSLIDASCQAYYLPTKADLFIAQFRRWLDRFGGGGPFGRASTTLDPLLWRTREVGSGGVTWVLWLESG